MIYVYVLTVLINKTYQVHTHVSDLDKEEGTQQPYHVIRRTDKTSTCIDQSLFLVRAGATGKRLAYFVYFALRWGLLLLLVYSRAEHDHQRGYLVRFVQWKFNS